jgi:hypothetical protein
MVVTPSQGLQFDEALFILGLFHWKQALRRKMLEYHISKPVISELLNSGYTLYPENV